ncbi:spore germination protein [Paenibacillus chitinolyticus]|uniref:spore germination protein n=1 Tax=Paenibacillus chitinolyticus TaxID=79263 RepID=UPI003869FA85
MTDQNDSRKPDGRSTLPAAPTLNADQWDILLPADTDGVIQLFQELLPTDEFQWILTDNGSSGCMFMSTAIDKSLFQDDVAPRLSRWESQPDDWPTLFPTGTHIRKVSDTLNRMLQGDVILLHNRLPHSAISFPAPFQKGRAIEPPKIERVILGPQESFVEDIDVNLGLLRRRLRDPNLIVHYYEVGERSKTTVAVVYLNDVAQQKWVDEIESKIEVIQTDSIVLMKELMEFISGPNLTPFPLYEKSELPARSALNLLKGRIGVLMDGSPFISFLPNTVLTGFIGGEAVMHGSLIPTFVRLVRILAFVIAIYAPAVYLALVTVDSSILPTVFAISIAQDQAGIPYTSLFETLMMMIVMDVLNEGMTYVPGNVGSALNVVGSLIIGQAAAQAGLTSKFMIIVASISAVGAYIASYQISYAARLWKYPFILAAGLFGFYGITVCSVLLLGHLASTKSLGLAYTSPFSPFSLKAIRMQFFRPAAQKLKERDPVFKPADKHSQRGDSS